MNQSTMRAELRMRWQELHQELLVDERFSGRLAGLFEGHQPEGYQLLGALSRMRGFFASL